VVRGREKWREKVQRKSLGSKIEPFSVGKTKFSLMGIEQNLSCCTPFLPSFNLKVTVVNLRSAGLKNLNREKEGRERKTNLSYKYISALERKKRKTKTKQKKLMCFVRLFSTIRR
jgi:hypothetical protein